MTKLLFGFLTLLLISCTSTPSLANLTEQIGPPPGIELCEKNYLVIEWIVPQESLRVSNPTDCTYINLKVILRPSNSPMPPLLTREAPGFWDQLSEIKSIEYLLQVHLSPYHKATVSVNDFRGIYGNTLPDPNVDYKIYIGHSKQHP